MKLAKISILFRALNSRNLTLAILFSFPLVTSGNPIAVLAGIWIIFVIMISGAVWSYIYWTKYDYSFTQDSFDVKYGIIRKQKREVPYRRIQNVDTSSNLFQRLVGIVRVDLESAGGGSTEISLRYVKEDEAERIKKKIRTFKQENPAVSEEETEIKSEETEKELIYELKGRDMTVLSLFTVNSRSIALIFFIFTFFAGSIWTGLERFTNFPEFHIGLFMFVFGITLTWLLSIFYNFSKFYGFKLWRRDESLEYERGLFRKYTGSIPVDKVQFLTFEENPLKRILGYATLRVDTAGYSPSTSSDKGSEAAIPLTKKSKAIEIAKTIENFETPIIEKIPKRARYRYFVRYYAATFLIISGILYYLETPIGYYFIALIVLPFISYIGAYFKQKNKGFYPGKNYFFTRNGFWNRNTVVMPYYRIQNILRTQTVLQERWKLSTVLLDTAGSRITGSTSKAVDLDEKDAERTFEETFDGFMNSLEDK